MQRVEQGVDIVAGGAEATAGADRARDRAAVTAAYRRPRPVDALSAHAEEADEIRMRAETPVAHADPELGAQPGRHQGVVHPLHGERHHGQAVVLAGTGVLAPRPEDAHASMERSPSYSRAASAAS